MRPWRAAGQQLPFETVEQTISSYLEEASYRRALAQYVTYLAGRARLEGIDLVAADGALVQKAFQPQVVWGAAR